MLQPEGPATPYPSDPRLGALFEELATATSVAQAHVAEQRIWSIWFEAGDPAVDREMRAGMEATERGDAGAAMRAFDAVVAARPSYAEGFNRRATLNYLLRRFPESEADIARTLALEPRHFGALSGLALIREAQNDAFGALEALEQVIRIHPQMPHLAERIERLSSTLGEAI